MNEPTCPFQRILAVLTCYQERVAPECIRERCAWWGRACPNDEQARAVSKETIAALEANAQELSRENERLRRGKKR